jgi:hypothetical protein
LKKFIEIESILINSSNVPTFSEKPETRIKYPETSLQNSY